MLSLVVAGAVFLLSIFGNLQYFESAYEAIFSKFMKGKHGIHDRPSL